MPIQKVQENYLHKESDKIFYILEGTASLLINNDWIDAENGTFAHIPSDTLHDFKNRTNKRMGLLNFFIPGGFERNMSSIVRWFRKNPEPTKIGS